MNLPSRERGERSVHVHVVTPCLNPDTVVLPQPHGGRVSTLLVGIGTLGAVVNAPVLHQVHIPIIAALD